MDIDVSCGLSAQPKTTSPISSRRSRSEFQSPRYCPCIRRRVRVKAEDVDVLDQRLNSVQLNETMPARRRAPKRGMEPYEDAKNLIYSLLADPYMESSERILRFEQEIQSLIEHRESDDLYNRAIGLLELALERQLEKMQDEVGWTSKVARPGV